MLCYYIHCSNGTIDDITDHILVNTSFHTHQSDIYKFLELLKNSNRH